ncbi:MAG: winged helix-turn-helix domain-containing protein [Solirubrobacterales bacterium]
MTTTSEREGAPLIGKSIEERVGTALGHRIRVEILALLNEGVYTADQLAALIGESRQTVHHHLKVLLRDNSIEIAKVERRRNANLYFYRAIEMPSFDEEELAAMTPEQRQAIAGLIVQHATAEIMAALASGKLSEDPAVVLAWRWFNLDEQGRRDLLAEQERLWHRAGEIEAESTNRRAQSGEESTTIVLAEFGFERARKAPDPPTVSDS